MQFLLLITKIEQKKNISFISQRKLAMIRLVDRAYASYYAPEIDAMFRSRAETFSERLGWEVVVENGYERDRFDDMNPLYLISVDPHTGEYWGSLRLLPTTGPNMLRDVFPQLLGDDEPVADATIWESSRICVANREDQPDRTKSWLNYVLLELLIGIGEVGQSAGLTKIVSVFDARMLRILKTAGCNPRIIGTPQRIGKVMSYAALFDGSSLVSLKETLGVVHSVLAPGADKYFSVVGGRNVGDSHLT